MLYKAMFALGVMLLDIAGHGKPAGAAKPGPVNASAAGVRAMWLWSRADPTSVVNWASSHGVKEIFAAVDWNVATNGDLPRLTSLKQKADAAGIGLSALNGDPGWVFDQQGALTWQRNVLATGLFSGTHVDVEPYALAQWNTDRAGTVSAFLALLGALQADSTAPLEADVPFWYQTIDAPGGNLADAVLTKVDKVTVMSYRDTATGPNSMMDVGTDMLSRGSTAGKPVRLGAETQRLGDCPNCTFYEEGQQVMTTTLSNVDTAAASYSAFSGIAVHHYDSWIALKP